MDLPSTPEFFTNKHVIWGNSIWASASDASPVKCKIIEDYFQL